MKLNAGRNRLLKPSTLKSETTQQKRGYKWIATMEGGTKRVIHASVLVGDIIYIIGGCCIEDEDQEDRPIEILALHTDSMQWKLLEPPNQPADEIPFMRHGHSAVAHEGYVYVFGGRSYQSFCNNLFRYDPGAHRWTRVATEGYVPAALAGHSMCLLGDKGYVYGGFKTTLNMFSNDIYLLDFRTFVWTFVSQRGAPPSTRYFHTACLLGERMYVFGGQSVPEDSVTDLTHCQLYSNQVVYFDIPTSRWHRPKQRGEIPPGRRSHSVFVYRDEMFIYGGFDSSTAVYYGDMYRFNPRTAAWSSFPIHVGPVNIPRSRRGHTTVVAGDYLFLLGGITTATEEQKRSLSLKGVRVDRDYDLLTESNGCYVLDLSPSLKTLCMAEVIQNNLPLKELPRTLQTQISRMFTCADMVCPALRNL